MRKDIAGIAAAVVLMAGVSQAEAASFVNSFEIDISVMSITDDGFGGQLLSGTTQTAIPITPFTPSATPSAGDVLTTTVNFANGDRLKVIDGPNIVDTTGPTFFEGFAFLFRSSTGPESGTSSTTTSVTYFDLLGSAIDTTGLSSGILGQGVGQSFGIDLTDSFISFTGLTITTTIDTLPVGNGPYDIFTFHGGRAGGFEIIPGVSQAVPEPGALAVFGFGIAGLGWVRRRARSVP